MADIAYLVPLFGSVAEIARVAGTHRSAVHRWQKGERPIRPVHQERLLRAAEIRRFDVEQVASALDVPRCPYCGHHHIVQ